MTSTESTELLIRLDQSLIHLKSQLDHVEDMGEKTLQQTIKINGRVQSLEKENDYRKADIEDIYKEISPLIEDVKKHTSFVDKVTGNWQAIAVAVLVFVKIAETLHWI